MIEILFDDKVYEISEGESLLEGLLTQNVSLPYGCKNGSCQSCLIQCIEGLISPESQKGLKQAHQINRYLLACQCIPQGYMQITLPNTPQHLLKASVRALRRLSSDVMEVRLQPKQAMNYRSGQFIRLYHPEGLARSYSLASVPSLDDDLILHVKEYHNEKLSPWIHHHLNIGDEVSISEAMGDCFYLPGHSDQPLLLIGTGTGLAPLFGILREALQQRHHAPIHLFHGVKDINSLYLSDELNQIIQTHPQFSYSACVSDPDIQIQAGTLLGRASDIALDTYPDLKGWQVYLCGNPDMVRSTQIQAFLANAALHDIHLDPFEIQV